MSPTPLAVDVRATRFGGALTALGAAATIGLHTADGRAGAAGAAVLAIILLAAAVGGPRANAWARIHRHALAPRLPPPRPDQLEPVEPPRFANLVGGVLLVGAAAADLLGPAWVGLVAVAVVGALAALNATTGFCLGCRLYGPLVLAPRTRRARRAA